MSGLRGAIDDFLAVSPSQALANKTIDELAMWYARTQHKHFDTLPSTLARTPGDSRERASSVQLTAHSDSRATEPRRAVRFSCEGLLESTHTRRSTSVRAELAKQRSSFAQTDFSIHALPACALRGGKWTERDQRTQDEALQALQRMGMRFRATPGVKIAWSQTDFNTDALPGCTLNRTGWSESDQRAQDEALQLLQSMAKESKGSAGKDHAEARLAQCEAALCEERAKTARLEVVCAREQSYREATKAQLLCLEQELDGKEGTIQAQDRELQKLRSNLRATNERPACVTLEMSQDSNSSTRSGDSGYDDAYVQALRSQLGECQRQLELKDERIQWLLQVLHLHRGIQDVP